MEAFKRKRSQASLSKLEEKKTQSQQTLAAQRKKLRDKAKARARRSDTIGHLGPEAVAAFVDGEMDAKSTHRVRVHLVHCPECRGDVHRQRGAAEWVRQCNIDSQVKAPRDLMAKLTNIAATCQDNSGGTDAPRSLPQQDIMDKLEMIVRAIKHNQRSH